MSFGIRPEPLQTNSRSTVLSTTLKGLSVQVFWHNAVTFYSSATT